MKRLAVIIAAVLFTAMTGCGVETEQSASVAVTEYSKSVATAETAIVPCFSTPLGVFISCPACKAKRLMRLYPETTGAGVALFCRRCKRELVVDIQPGTSPDRVTLREINAAAG